MYLYDYIVDLKPINDYEEGRLLKIELRSIMISDRDLEPYWNLLPPWLQEDLKDHTQEHLKWLAEQNYPEGGFWIGGKPEDHKRWQRQMDKNFKFLATLL